jgi:hypothetical protein
MRNSDQRMYRTFEEFEREELRRGDGLSGYMDDMLCQAMVDELDFEPKGSRRAAADDDDED